VPGRRSQSTSMLSTARSLFSTKPARWAPRPDADQGSWVRRSAEALVRAVRRDLHGCFTPTLAGYYPQGAAIPRRRGRGPKSTRSGAPVCFQRRSNALIVSTWGMAVVRAFHTAARAARLAAAHGQPVAAAAHGQPTAAAVHERPVAVAPRGRQAAAVAPRGRQAAAVAHGQLAAVAPHEQLGAVGEPMVAAAGHGRPAALGKARER
jgi:hypothetical protein